MANNENLLAVLASRRRNNFKSQFKSVVLEGLEIFGYDLVNDVYNECMEIYKDYTNIESNSTLDE